MKEQGQFENSEQENLPYLETAKWLDGIVKGGKSQTHLGDGSELRYREVREPIWQLAEAYRQGEFSGKGGDKKYIKTMYAARESLGGKPNNSEGLLIGWLGNMLAGSFLAVEEEQL